MPFQDAIPSFYYKCVKIHCVKINNQTRDSLHMHIAFILFLELRYCVLKFVFFKLSLFHILKREKKRKKMLLHIQNIIG